MLARNITESPINWADTDRSAECVVYCIKHIDSGAEYVGSTSRALRQRVKEHRKDVRNGSLQPLHIAIRSFGWNAFSIEILDYSSRETLRADEASRINSMPCAFNQAKGADSPSAGWHHNQTTKIAQGVAKVGGRNPAARSVVVNGISYKTVKDCASAIGISFPTIRNRLLDSSNVDYQYMENSVC